MGMPFFKGEKNMQITSEQVRLYAITDSQWLQGRTLYDCVEAALQGGVTMLQIREKHADTATLTQLAIPIVQLCHQYHVPCIINDDVIAAKESGADGVHVGQNDTSIAQARAILGNEKWIGTSAHQVEEAIRAQQEGADYIGTGAVFGSATKQDATPLQRETLRAICQAVTIPVVAIGGITAENGMQLQGFGGQGIAVISAIFAQPDLTAAAQQMRHVADIVCGGES
jgi:thiamine-phosphate pyrophosphorylase